MPLLPPTSRRAHRGVHRQASRSRDTRQPITAPGGVRHGSGLDQRHSAGAQRGPRGARSPYLAPGKRTLVEQLEVQRSTGSTPHPTHTEASAVQHAAAQGIADAGGPLPHASTIQRLFGHHDISAVEAHVGGDAAAASRTIGAEAYATGHHIAFSREPSLHTAAHEAAHVIQQRSGVPLKGGVGKSGDPHEQHANAVAEAVVSGRSAAALLDRYVGSSGEAPVVQRQVPPVDAGVVPAGVGPDPATADLAAMHDANLGQAYEQAKTSGDRPRAQAFEDEMDRRWEWGTAAPRGPQPVTAGSSAVARDVALSLLDNMAEGKPPFKPSEGVGGCSWFTTEGNPYTSVSADKSIKVPVEIAKGNSPLVFREADLVKIFDELTGPTRLRAEADYRAKFQIPEGTPLSKRALKAIGRVLDRFIEKAMWKRVGETVAASSQKVGEVILEDGGRFSDRAGKFAVVADANKISLKGGTGPLVDALAKDGVGAEPVVVEAAEALANKMKWAGRVRGVFRYGGRLLIVIGVTADLIRIFRAHDRLKATLTAVSGWTAATAAGAAFAAYWTPADVAGPWHGQPTASAP